MQTVAEIEQHIERLPDLYTGRIPVEVVMTEWDANEHCGDAEGNDLPPSDVLNRTVSGKRDGVEVRLSELPDRTGDLSELSVGIYPEGNANISLEGLLKLEQIDAMIELLQATRTKAAAVFVTR